MVAAQSRLARSDVDSRRRVKNPTRSIPTFAEIGWKPTSFDRATSTTIGIVEEHRRDRDGGRCPNEELTEHANPATERHAEMTTASEVIEYSEIPARAKKVLEGFLPPEDKIAARVAELGQVPARPFDSDGDQEVLDGVTFTHHFVDAPGDEETIRFHYVEAGQGEPIVFLHGIPDSWFQWHHQMAALSATHRCIAFDLKGYGQSGTAVGDYRHEAAAEQLLRAIDLAGVDKFNVVTHDRGTVQADFIVAKHPARVLRYARGEQHLYHFHPDLAPRGALFADALCAGLMDDPAHFVTWVYTWICKSTACPTPRCAGRFRSSRTPM